MKDMLEKFGFTNTLDNNIWTKFNWTIRFSEEEVEAFNNPLYNIIGKYYKCPKTELNLSNILSDIEEFIKEGI